MLFLQGTRDALADTRLMHSVVTALIAPVTMKLVESADHSFHVLARSGMTDKEIMRDLLDAFVEWTQEVIRST